VKKGDTLTAIATRYNTTVKKLQELNPSLIKNVNKISVGWVLKVPANTQTTKSCKTCEALKTALNDIENLQSVKALERLIGG